MSGENPHMGTFDGYDVIAWEKGTGRMEYPSGSIADVLEITSGTVVSNLAIDVSYYYDQVAGNSWWHFNTYDENGESAPGVSNGKPHADGFGDFPGDYKMVSLAIHSLSFTAPDKAALKEAIDLGGRYDLDKYVEEGKAEFTEALETAKEVYGNGNALQEEVTRERRCIQDSAGGSAGCDGR